MTYDPKSVDLKRKLNHDKLFEMAFKQNEAIKFKDMKTVFFCLVLRMRMRQQRYMILKPQNTFCTVHAEREYQITRVDNKSSMCFSKLKFSLCSFGVTLRFFSVFFLSNFLKKRKSAKQWSWSGKHSLKTNNKRIQHTKKPPKKMSGGILETNNWFL